MSNDEAIIKDIDSYDNSSEDVKEEFMKDGVKFTYPELVSEHEKLVKALETQDPKLLAEQAKDQKAELEKYKSHSEGKETLIDQTPYCFIHGFEVKELEGELYVDGFIATSHIDSVDDKVPKHTMDNWAKQINSGDSSANKASYHHDRKPKVVGVGVKESAKVVKLPDNEYGLFVRTHVNKTCDEYKELKYEIENNFIDGFSIEYNTHNGATTHKEMINGREIRVLDPSTELGGWGFASRAIQKEAAIIGYSYKEIIKGDCMEEESKEKSKAGEQFMVADKKQEELAKEQPGKDEPDEDDKDEKKKDKKKKSEKDEDDKNDDDKVEEKKKSEKKEEADLILESKEKLAISNVVQKVNTMEVKEQVLKQEVEVKEMPIEVKEFKEVLEGKITGLNEQVRIAGALCEKKELLDVPTSRAESREYKSFRTNGTKLEYKSLGVTTNQNTDTDYLLSAAELQDVFDPIIYNLLNQKTVTWNLLDKDSYAGKGNNQVQFTGKIAANTTAAFYTGNAVNTGNVTRLKFQTKFKKLQVGISVDGDMIASARGGPVSDIFAQEVMDSTIDLLSYLNGQLFGVTGTETGAGIIGFSYIANSAAYTSLYNLTRSSTNKLAPDSAGDTYINQASTPISLTNLRAAIVQAVKEAANKNNLIFITHPTQANMLRAKFDAERRMLTSKQTDFGFSTDLFIDGVPIFEDKDCTNTKWFLIDKETHRVAIWIPPTIEMLGKVGDSMDGFIKMYLATYNRAPRRLVEIYGCATS